MDIKNFSTTGPVDTESRSDVKWWTKKGEEAAQSISQVLQFLMMHQGMRQTQYVVSTRLYGNLAIMGINGLSYSRISTVQNTLKDRISYNVCQSCVDTVVAKIAKNKPKPLFLTSKGDYKVQRKAEKLNQFIDGIFYENKAYQVGTQAFRDAAIYGDGITHVYNYNGRVKHERVLPGELYVDEVEGFYGEPRNLHRIKNIDRMVLIDHFPEKTKMIMNANAATPETAGAYPNISDQVTVRESWHLPSGPEAKDGKHMITINEGTLFSEEWTKPRFPFAFMRWCKRQHGFWSQGGIEQIQNIQLEINKLLWVIQRSFHLMGTFKIWLKNGSKVVKEHLNNEIGNIISGDEMPQYLSPPIVQPEIFSHLSTLKQSAFEMFGVSMLSAASKKPEGLDSGKALREYNDIESDRFMTIGQAYENYFLDLATLSIDVAKDIYEDEGSYEVKVPGKKFIETIDWSDIDLADDEYVMKCYPVSSLPSDPAGKLQTVQEYAQAGYIQPRQARRLLDFPDLDAVETLANAAEDYLHEILEKIVDADLEEEDESDIYTPPESYDDLALARELALEYYTHGKTNSLEEAKLELLRRFIDQVDVLQQEAQAPPQQLPGSQPQAAPMPQPTSDLIPNVPGAGAA